jgi:ribosomal protein L44E
LKRGIGNKGRYSKKAIKSWKRKTKTTKKTNIMYTCQICGKSKYQKKGIRSGKQLQE